MEKREDDCEVDAGIYEVGLHGWWRGITFAASMSAGRVLKSLMVKRVRKEKDFGTMNRTLIPQHYNLTLFISS